MTINKTVKVGNKFFYLELSADESGIAVLNTTRQQIGFVTLDSFDPVKFPYVGIYTDYVVTLARKLLKEKHSIQETKLNTKIGNCFLVEISNSNGKSIRIIKSSIKKDLAIRLITHATINKTRVFGQASVTLMNALESDICNITDYISPSLIINDGINGMAFCLLSNRHEAIELLEEYKKDIRYKDQFDDSDYSHQTSKTKNYINSVNEFENLINERWPGKEIVKTTETIIPEKLTVTVSKADFIRSNPKLSTSELIDAGSKIGIDLKSNYINKIRA